MLARKILPRSTKSLLRQVLTGARQHQLPVVYAPDRDQMLGNTLYNRGFPARSARQGRKGRIAPGVTVGFIELLGEGLNLPIG